MNRLAIVGAGVAGLALAALLRRRGVPYTLIEQSARFGAVGAGIQLSPNGVRILQRLGVGPVLAEHGMAANAIEIRRWDDGSVLSTTPLGAQSTALFGAPYYLIHRADLQRGMLGLLPPGEAQLSRRVTGVTEHRDHVRLSFADGTTADVAAVIGADGVHSVVRSAVVRDEPRFSGYSVFRGLLPASAVPSFAGDPRVLFWYGPGRHITYYPIAAGRTVHVSAVCATPSPSSGEPDRPLADYFTGWHADVRRVVALTPAVTRWGLSDRDLAPRYRTDRIALVGDAAHPTLPYLSQGANQALEDVLVLADCLAADDDLPVALRRYEAARHHRTARIHREARLRAATFHLPDGPEQRQRDLVLAKQQDLDHLDWLYGHDPG